MTDTVALFAPAVKEQLKARVAIDGPTGSGKTWTALQWARIIAGPDGKVGVIDTENRSAAYYAPTPGVEPERVNYWDPPYVFGHMPVSPPYSPTDLVRLIPAAAAELGPDGVLVIDSLTHYWSGEGGTLDLVDHAAHRSGSSFNGWREGTPAQRAMIDAVVHAACHVVVTMRSKMEYVVEERTNRDGRTVSVPVKLGLKPEQRADVEYEFTVVADMDLEHRLTVGKSRCDALADVVATLGRSAEPAQVFADWLGAGVERIGADDLATLTAMFDSVADDETRRHLKGLFVGEFRKPAELIADEVPAAVAWVAERLTALDPEPDEAEPVYGPDAADAEAAAPPAADHSVSDPDGRQS